MTTPENTQALSLVARLAHAHGLSAQLEIIADRSNLVVWLRPHELVARVAMAESMVRAGSAWLGREVELSRFLDDRGLPVTRPARDVPAVPFVEQGMSVSFWQRERESSLPFDASGAGRGLARVHRELCAYTGELPVWGAWLEARAALARATQGGLLQAHERERLLRAWDEGERIVAGAERRSASFQPVHGDAHVRNVLWSTRGPLWTDWEDAFVGPVEYDLAALRSKLELFGEDREVIEAVCAAYDGPLDGALVRDLGLVRNLQVIPWLAVFAERDPSLLERMRARIACLPGS